MRKIFLVCLVIAALPGFAQQSNTSYPQSKSQIKKEKKKEKIDSLVRQEEEGVINYTKQTDLGVKLISDGYGIFLDIGRAKSVKRSVLYQIEISERKSHREVKQSSNYPSASPLIFGKVNFVYNGKFGIQEQYLLANKANKHGVNITCNVGGGIALAVLRPYEYEVQYNSGEIKYIQFNNFFNNNNSFDTTIYTLMGGPSIGQGWDDLSLSPGVYGKAALRFDYGHYTKTVTALEIGVSGEYYTKKIPIIYNTDPQHFFLTAFVDILFGWRKK